MVHFNLLNFVMLAFRSLACVWTLLPCLYKCSIVMYMGNSCNTEEKSCPSFGPLKLESMRRYSHFITFGSSSFYPYTKHWWDMKKKKEKKKLGVHCDASFHLFIFLEFLWLWQWNLSLKHGGMQKTGVLHILWLWSSLGFFEVTKFIIWHHF